MNNRILGTIAMICAPALLVEVLLVGGGDNSLLIGIASMVFMAGWLCANTAMRRMRAAGNGKWGRAVLLVQLVGLVLAFMFGFFEATGLLAVGNIVWAVTNAAWPLSMLWMLVVGITVIRANRIHGWRRFVPVLCPFWLLVAMIGSMIFGEAAGNLAGFGYAAVLWVLLDYSVLGSGEQPAPAPGPAVAG